MSAVFACALAAFGVLGATQVGGSRQEGVAARRLSRLAGEVTVQALLARQYEKDLFLNIADRQAQADFLAKWVTAYADLGRAIEEFATAATTVDDRRLAEAWRAQRITYGNAFLQVRQTIGEGRIATPADARAALEPHAPSIQMLSESAVALAQVKADAAERGAVAAEQARRRLVWLALSLAALLLLREYAASLAPRRDAGRQAGAAPASRPPIMDSGELGQLPDSFNHIALAMQPPCACRRAGMSFLPLTATISVVPLVGAFDAASLNMIKQQTIEKLAHRPVRCLILDVAGVPAIDMHAAQALGQIAEAARLTGADVILAGARAEVAEMIVGYASKDFPRPQIL